MGAWLLALLKLIPTLWSAIQSIIPVVKQWLRARRNQSNHETIQGAVKNPSAQDGARDVNDLFRGTKSEKPTPPPPPAQPPAG